MRRVSNFLFPALCGLAYGGSLHWAAMVGLALILMAMVLAVTIIGAWQRRTNDAASF